MFFTKIAVFEVSCFIVSCLSLHNELLYYIIEIKCFFKLKNSHFFLALMPQRSLVAVSSTTEKSAATQDSAHAGGILAPLGALCPPRHQRSLTHFLGLCVNSFIFHSFFLSRKLPFTFTNKSESHFLLVGLLRVCVHKFPFIITFLEYIYYYSDF